MNDRETLERYILDAIRAVLDEVQGARHIVKVLTNKVAELEKKNERLRESCEGVLAAPELQARIDAALAELDDFAHAWGFHIDEPDCVGCIMKQALLKILKGKA